MQWLNSFKIALIEEDTEKLKELISDMPCFEKLEDMQTAFSLISEAISLITQKRDQIKKDMDRLNKAKSFLDLEPKKNSYEFFS
ncbi:MAG: hypothetical protein GXO31_08190 [Epsilonproteobacteria bacterium]|nr:hypothetical protein [Campylobacterota bacterium]